MLQDPTKFLESLFKYDNDNIPDAVIQKIQPYIDMEDFTPAAISKVRVLHCCIACHRAYYFHHCTVCQSPLISFG
jgi:dynein heavy chain